MELSLATDLGEFLRTRRLMASPGGLFPTLRFGFRRPRQASTTPSAAATQSSKRNLAVAFANDEPHQIIPITMKVKSIEPSPVARSYNFKSGDGRTIGTLYISQSKDPQSRRLVSHHMFRDKASADEKGEIKSKTLETQMDVAAFVARLQAEHGFNMPDDIVAAMNNALNS